MKQEPIQVTPSWGNDKWSDPDSGSATSDALSVSTCSASSCQCDPCRSYREYLEWKKKAGKGATPETDAQLNLSSAGGPQPWHVHADFVRRMERERNRANELVNDYERDKKKIGVALGLPEDHQMIFKSQRKAINDLKIENQMMKLAMSKIHERMQGPAKNRTYMQIAGPARECLNLVKHFLPNANMEAPNA